MQAYSTITGLILAGGQGLRMGGVDKGLQLLHSKPLVAHVHARLASQVGAVMISANRNAQQYAAYAPVMADAVEGFAGPLAGVQAGLAVCATPYLLVVPCDAPCLPLDLAQRLLHTLEAGQARAAYVQVQEHEGEKAQAHPVFCLLQTRLKDAVAAVLAPQISANARRGSMLDFLQSMDAVPCVFKDAQAFTNLNDIQALKRFGSVALR
jgi:molybdenum cofactor guanylyltransferase